MRLFPVFAHKLKRRFQSTCRISKAYVCSVKMKSRFGILPVAQRRITLLGVKPVAKVDYLSKRVCEKLILVNECYNKP